MDYSKARVMDSHPHTQAWCLLESWHIQRKQATLNIEKGCQNSTPLCWRDNATNWHRLSILWLPCNNYYYYLLLPHGIVSYYSATLRLCWILQPLCFLACASPLSHMTCHHLSSTKNLHSSTCVWESSLMKASVGNRNVWIIFHISWRHKDYNREWCP